MTREEELARLESMLDEMLELDEPARRARIAEIAADEPKFATELERLLAASESGDLRTLQGTLPLDASSSDEDRGRPVLPRYRVLQRIGEGGFGTVWLAEQTEPVRRQVAVKVLKPGLDSGQVLARFEAERQALALMDHPNIARVLDAGSDELGRPFVVMELVRGVPIDEYCRNRDLDLEDRIRMTKDVASAVQHAHTKGVIHRDLKPANILVGEVDGHPVPKVIDFGVAKAMQAPLTDRTLFTEFRQFVGTPEYMSPEQAELSIVDVDARSDVYSLGVLLYELVTGSPPFEPEMLRGSGFDEMRRIIREVDPPMPSTRATALASSDRPGVESHRIRRVAGLVRGELDWIIMKAMAKARDRRYGTAAELATDLGRLLAGEPVEAAPPSRLYRMRRFVGRHRAGVAIMATAALATASVAAASSFGWRAANDRNVALETAERAEQEKRAAAESRADELAAAVAAREEAVARLEEDLVVRRVALAAEYRDSDGGLARAYLDAIPADRMPWLGRIVDSMLPVIEAEPTPTGPTAVLGIAADPRRVASISTGEEGSRVVVEREDGRRFDVVETAPVGLRVRVESNRDGGRLVRFGRDRDRVAIDGSLLRPETVEAMRVDRGGFEAAAEGDGGGTVDGVLLCDLETGDRRFVEPPGAVMLGWDLSPDGRTVVVLGPDGARVADLEGRGWTLDRRWETDRFSRVLVAVDDDGTIAAACSGHLASPEEDQTIHGWVQLFRDDESVPEDVFRVMSIQQVNALELEGPSVAMLLGRSAFEVVPFGMPETVVAVSRRVRPRAPGDGPTGGRATTMARLDDSASTRQSGVLSTSSTWKIPGLDAGRLDISAEGRFVSVVRGGGIASLVDATTGDVFCTFMLPTGPFGLVARDDGTISGWSLSAAAGDPRRRWNAIGSRPVMTEIRRFPRGVDPGRFQATFGEGSLVVGDDGRPGWRTAGGRIALDATDRLVAAIGEPDANLNWCVFDGGRRLAVSAYEISRVMRGDDAPFVESWDLATGARTTHRDLRDGDRLMMPIAMVPGAAGAIVSGVVFDADDPGPSLMLQLNVANLNNGDGLRIASAVVGDPDRELDFQDRSGLVAGEVGLPDGEVVSVETNIDLTRPTMLVRAADGAAREIGLPFAVDDFDVGDLMRNGLGGRLVMLDDGAAVGVLGKRLVIIDTAEWLPLGTISPGLLAGGATARWNAIRAMPDGGVELAGSTADGRVRITVPGSSPASRPPVGVPTS